MYPAGVPGIGVRYVKLDRGLTLRAIESGPPNGDAVLLVHGWGGCVYSYAEMIPALVHAGYRAIAIDLPGFGLSDKPIDEALYTTDAFCDVISEFTSAIGLGRFTYVGHSMGAALGLRLALRRQRGLERLVLLSSVGLAKSPVLAPLRLVTPRVAKPVLPALLFRTTVALVLRFAYATPDRPTERDIDEYWAVTQFDEYAWACRALLHQVDFSPVPAEALSTLKLPVLVIIGGRDRVVRSGESRARLIPSARVVPIPEGGHIMLQECARTSNAELLAFLARVPAE